MLLIVYLWDERHDKKPPDEGQLWVTDTAGGKHKIQTVLDFNRAAGRSY